MNFPPEEVTRILIVPAQVVERLLNFGARTDRDRTQLHDLLDRCVRVRFFCLVSQQAKHDPVIIQYGAKNGSVFGYTLQSFTDGLRQTAAGYCALQKIDHQTRLAVFCLYPQPVSKPVHLTGHVTVDLTESKALEPRRGPWAQVSLIIVTIHNDRLGLIQFRRAFSFELRQRDVDGAGEMNPSVFFRWQHLDKLGSPLHQLLYLVAIDCLRHFFLSKLSSCTSVDAIAGKAEG